MGNWSICIIQNLKVAAGILLTLNICMLLAIDKSRKVILDL